MLRVGDAEDGSYHFTLAGQEDQVSKGACQPDAPSELEGWMPYLIAMLSSRTGQMVACDHLSMELVGGGIGRGEVEGVAVAVAVAVCKFPQLRPTPSLTRPGRFSLRHLIKA